MQCSVKSLRNEGGEVVSRTCESMFQLFTISDLNMLSFKPFLLSSGLGNLRKWDHNYCLSVSPL